MPSIDKRLDDGFDLLSQEDEEGPDVDQDWFQPVYVDVHGEEICHPRMGNEYPGDIPDWGDKAFAQRKF